MTENHDEKTLCSLFINQFKRRKINGFRNSLNLFFLLIILLIFDVITPLSIQAQASYYSPTPSNGFAGSRVFRQEIARLEVTVSRDGKPPRIALKISGVTSVAYPIFRTISFQ